MKTASTMRSAGLVGSECVRFFAARGFAVHVIDNNLRADLFGPDGETSWHLAPVQRAAPGYVHRALDGRGCGAMETLVRDLRPELIVHCVAHPSHDLAGTRPFDHFAINSLIALALKDEQLRAFRPLFD